MKFIFLLSTLLFLFSINLVAQNKDSSLVKRIELLEANETLFDQKKKLTLQEIESKNRLLAFLATLGSAAVFGIGFWSAKKYFDKKLDKEIDGMIAEKLKEKDALIKKMIADADIEQNLLNTKKIKIVGEANQQAIKQVLRNVNYNMQHLIDDVNSKDYDLLLINNNQGKFYDGADKTLITNLLKDMNPKACVLYYCSGRVFFPSGEPVLKQDLHKINFATNPAQIYGNLLNSLKYQDKIA